MLSSKSFFLHSLLALALRFPHCQADCSRASEHLAGAWLDQPSSDCETRDAVRWLRHPRVDDDGLSDLAQRSTECTWRFVSCTNVLVSNPFNFTSAERWNGLCAPKAVEEVVNHFLSNPNYGSFTEAVSDVLNTRDFMKCHFMTPENGCRYSGCEDGARNTGASGYLIANSIVAVYNIYAVLRGTLESAELHFQSGVRLDRLPKAFFPEEGDDPIISIPMNFLVSGLTAYSASFISTVLREPSRFDESTLTTAEVKELTYLFATFMTSTAKELYNTKFPNSDIREGAFTAVNTLLSQWGMIIETANFLTFQRRGVIDTQLLLRLLENGKMLEGGQFSMTVQQREKLLPKLLYAYLLPHLWRSKGVFPVVIDAGLSCDDVRQGNNKWSEWSTPKNNHSAFCVDNKRYFLLSTTGSELPRPDCSKLPRLSPPFGLESLQYNKFISVADLGRSAVRRQEILASDPTAEFNPLDKEQFDVFFDRMTEMFYNNQLSELVPGVVDIPVCGPEA